MCKLCDMRQDMYDAVARRSYDPDTRAQIERGQHMVSQHMEQHGVSFDQAVEALGRARQAEFAELAATYAELHGLDDEQTLFALWAHGIDGPGSVQ